MAGITVPIDGDLSPILKTFGELPGRTQAEMAAVGAVIDREARRGSIAKGFAEMEGVSAASAKRAANAVIREMERASRDSEKALGEMKKGATVIFGGIVGDIEDVAGALMALGPASALVGGAIAGAAVVAGTAWLESQVVSYLYEAASATGELTNEQEALNAAMEKIQLTIGERVAPQFEGVLLVAIQLALRTNDLVQAFISGRDAAMELYESMSPLHRLMASPLLFPLELVSRAEQFGEAMVSNTGRAEKFVKRLEAVAKAEDAIKEANEKGIEAQKAAQRAQKTATDERRRSAQRAADAVMNEAKTREDAARKEAEALAAIRGRQARQEIEDDQDLTAQILGNIVAVDEARAKSAENYAAQLDAQAAADEERSRAGFEAEIARVQELQRARAQATQEYLFSGIAAAATLAQAVADSAEEGSAAQQAAAIAAFRLNQAGSIGTIAINTAEAITKAIALFGPPPSPAGVAGIAFASAIGLAQAAAVAAQAPPSFHTGGVIASNPLAPDETMIVARKGEEVRTRQEQGGGGANVTVQMVYQHRIFDSFIMDNMRQAGSPLRREIHKASGRRVGHRG